MTTPFTDDAIVGYLVENFEAHMKNRSVYVKLNVLDDALKKTEFKNQAIRFKILENLFKLLPRSEIFYDYALKACSLNIPIRKVLSLVKYSQADLAIVDRFGWNMLHHAVHNNHLKCVQQLLKENAMLVKTETCERETALFLGCANKNIDIEIIRLLVDCDPSAYGTVNDTYKSPLDMAVINQREDVVELLMEAAEVCLSPGNLCLVLFLKTRRRRY
jgi:ankyrin repeat protein